MQGEADARVARHALGSQAFAYHALKRRAQIASSARIVSRSLVQATRQTFGLARRAARCQCAPGNGRQIRNVSRRAVTAALHRPGGCVLRVEGGRVRQAALRDRSTGRAADGVRQPVGELPAWQQPRSTMAWGFARCGRVAASRPQPSRIILSRDRGALRRDGPPSFGP